MHTNTYKYIYIYVYIKIGIYIYIYVYVCVRVSIYIYILNILSILHFSACCWLGLFGIRKGIPWAIRFSLAAIIL